jgi:IclR family acetate operon transcriptional repressor
MPAPKRTPAHPLDRYRVPILDRTLDLLELLTRHPEGMTLSAMTEALRMPKNSVYRIASTLAVRGYAAREEATKVYRASSKLLALGRAAMGVERLAEAATPLLVSLRDATGETALLGTLAGGRGVVLDQVPSSHPVKVVVEIGHAFPLHTAAPAKAILAHWTPEQQRAFVRQMKFPKRTPRTLTTASAFLAELQQVRARGYALDRSEESETFACAAAPVFDHGSQPIAALWISGPSDRVTLEKLDTLAAVVRHFSMELSVRLGWMPPPGARPSAVRDSS